MGSAMMPDIRREPDAELHPAMSCDVEAAGSRRQVQFPLDLQVTFRGRFEGAGGQAPTIVSDPIDLVLAMISSLRCWRFTRLSS